MTPLRRIVACGVVYVAAGSACAPHRVAPVTPSVPTASERGHDGRVRGRERASESGAEFASRSASPELTAEREEDLRFCGQADAALDRVAERIVKHERRQQGAIDPSELVFALRAEGEPHVWPHSFTLSGATLAREELETRLHAFLDSFAEGGVRRCGVARSEGPDGTHTIAVVAVDALADLLPIPTQGRVGQWMHLEATLLVPAADAKVVILGPSGMPRTVPTTLHGDRVEASFALDRAGPFTVQLLASPDGGPRPVLEALIFADMRPPREFAESPAPGELESDGDDPDALYRMVNAARASESLPPLARNHGLDRVAGEQAAALERLGRLAHDAGEGNPVERLHRAGFSARRPGENVARAASLRLAHRHLWASPSHRGNLLDPHFDSLGVGAVRGGDGSVWVCEIFADFADSGLGSARPPAYLPVAARSAEPFSASRRK